MIAGGLALIIGVLGFMLRQSAGPVYIATSKVLLPNAANYPGMNITDSARVQAVLKGAAAGIVEKGDSLSIVKQDPTGSVYVVTAHAVGLMRADRIADSASETLKSQDWRYDKIESRSRRPGAAAKVANVMAEIIQKASDQDAQLDPDSPVTPFSHLLELFVYVAMMLFGGGTLISVVGKSIEQRSTMPVSMVESQASDMGIDLPQVHTLVTITQIAPRAAGRFSPPGDLVYSSGNEFPEDAPSPVLLAGTSINEETAIDLSVTTDIDEIFFERLAEYKRHYPDLGCVLLVTETLPSAFQSQTGGMFPSLNGAVAALSLARTVAQRTGISTLVVDTGSPEWTAFRKSKNPPDVMNLPKMPGVYDLLANKGSLHDWILEEEAIPSLMALSSGKVPRDWPEILRSDDMGAMIGKARKLAELIVIYAPRVIERPETVRIMGEWTNGIMIVSGVDAVAEAVEMQAVSMLTSAGASVFGRIALNTLESVGISQAQAALLKQTNTASTVEIR